MAGLKRLARFEISVAAYPEKHPDSPSIEADIDNLKAKVDAGADRAITQFFFDNDEFLRFLDRVRARGIDVPIVPGIVPIHNFSQVAGFASEPARGVPDWLARRFDGLENDPATAPLVAAAVAAEQVLDLVDTGIRHFHFYTLNRADLVYAICHLLGLAAESSEPAKEAAVARAPAAAMTREETNRSAQCRGEGTHPDHRRRHGHRDPGPRAGRGGLSAVSASRTGASDLQGNNDLLVLTQPEKMREHP